MSDLSKSKLAQVLSELNTDDFTEADLLAWQLKEFELVEADVFSKGHDEDGTPLEGVEAKLLPQGAALLRLLELPAAPEAEVYHAGDAAQLVRGLRWNCGRHQIDVIEWEGGSVEVTLVTTGRQDVLDPLLVAAALLAAEEKRREWEAEKGDRNDPS